MTPPVSVPPVRTPERAPGGFAWNRRSAPEGLKRRSVRGAAVTGVSHALKFVLRFGSTAILARLLSPEDFGLVAMTAVISGFIVLFTDGGLTTATIQREEITHEQISSLFWVNAAMGVVLSLVVVALGRPIALFYNDARLELITLVLSGSFLVSGLMVQHQALLRRNMRFTALAGIDIFATLGGCVVGVVMAWRGFGYWALVGLTLSTAVLTALGTWIMMPWRPGAPRRQHLRDSVPLLRFGGDVLMFNILNYLARRADVVLLGWYWGPVAVAFYDKAYTMLLLPIKQINGPLAGVAMPALSRAQAEPARHKRFFLSTVQLISSVSLPMVLIVTLFADQVVQAWLGSQWSESANLFRLLAVAAAINAINNPLGWFLISLGHTRRFRQFGIYNSALLVIAIALGLRGGAEGVALWYSGYMLLFFVPSWAYVLHGSAVGWQDVLRTLAPPVLSCLPAAVAGLGAARVINPYWGDWDWILGASAAGLVYSILLLVVFQRWRFFANLLQELRPQAKPKA